MEQLVRSIGCSFWMEATRRRHAGGGELSRAGLDSRPPPCSICEPRDNQSWAFRGVSLLSRGPSSGIPGLSLKMPF